jgi:hypothetical protein
MVIAGSPPLTDRGAAGVHRGTSRQFAFPAIYGPYPGAAGRPDVPSAARRRLNLVGDVECPVRQSGGDGQRCLR